MEGRTAIVTGAAYGLGVFFARTMAEAGADVVLAARSVDKLEEIAPLIEAFGVKSLVQECDVTDLAAVAQTVENAWGTFGQVDVLVNNAGVVAEVGVMPERLPDELFTSTMATNANGLFTFCREVGARQLADGEGGSIINVASIAGLVAQSHFPAAYQASKAAVINLTWNLASSWAKRGVRVNALCPGWFPSEMTPMKRVGVDGELDAALLFMAPDASSFMTGSTMVIDDGVTSTMGGTDYSPDMFAAMVEVAVEFGTAMVTLSEMSPAWAGDPLGVSDGSIG